MTGPGQLGERGLPPAVDRLLRASAAVTQRLNQRLHDACGLSLAQYQFLWAASAGPVTLGEVAALLGCTRGNVTGLADRLVDQGLVLRRHDPDDRRVAFVELTPAGRARLEAAGRVVLESLRGVGADPRLMPLLEALGSLAVTAEPAPEPAAGSEAEPAAGPAAGQRRRERGSAPGRRPRLREEPLPLAPASPAGGRAPTVRLTGDHEHVVIIRDDPVVRIGPAGPLAE